MPMKFAKRAARRRAYGYCGSRTTTPLPPLPSCRKKTKKKRSRIASLMEITRRVFAFLLVLCAPLVLFSSAESPRKSAAKGYLVYVGTYTTKTQSKGIYAFQFDAATGKMTAPELAAESPDPSFVAVHPDGKHLYAVNEAGKDSMVSAFALH